MHLFRGFVIHVTSYSNAFPGESVIFVDFVKIFKQTVEQSLPCDVIRMNVIIICKYCLC
jgi:hypothetical protein